VSPVIDDFLPLLGCPHCGGELSRASGGPVRCAAGHSFDVARHGYLSLLPGDARHGSADTAEMVAARERFLGAGHFDPLARALVEEAKRTAASGLDGGFLEKLERPAANGPESCIVDLGAGTGRYLAAVLDHLPGRAGLALDLSKHALRRAARAHPRAAAVACDAWRRLPLRDGVAGLVLSVFAPRHGAEIARVLRPGGALVVVTPTKRHLAEMVATLGLLSVDERKPERLAGQLEPHLSPAGRAEHEWRIALDRSAMSDLVAMGPSARHIDTAELDRRVAGLAEPVEVTASVRISVYRRY
jgi:23S rRNA (guanine745-N1)-methyltransferase